MLGTGSGRQQFRNKEPDPFCQFQSYTRMCRALHGRAEIDWLPNGTTWHTKQLFNYSNWPHLTSSTLGDMKSNKKWLLSLSYNDYSKSFWCGQRSRKIHSRNKSLPYCHSFCFGFTIPRVNSYNFACFRLLKIYEVRITLLFFKIKDLLSNARIRRKSSKPKIT